MSKPTDQQAHQIADLAIRLDAADRELFELERNGAYRAAREVRQRADQLRAQLADAVAATRGE